MTVLRVAPAASWESAPVSTSLFSADHVTLTLDAGVATLLLHRPPMNALSRQLQQQIADAARVAAADARVRAVIITGGEQVFAAGADIKEMAAWDRATAMAQIDELQDAFTSVAALPMPVIAAIAGYALGGGCELALCADLRMAADTAVLGLPEVSLGIIPGAGGTQRLPRLIGPSRAKDLILTGRRVNADEALRLGLVDRVVPADELVARASDLAVQLARGSSTALASAKRAIDAGQDQTLAEGLRTEGTLFAGLFGTADQREGFAAFLEKRPADFVGRPDGVDVRVTGE